MTLEMEAIETSLSKLAPSGWTPSIAYDKEADEELMREDRLEAEKREKRKKGSGFFGCECAVENLQLGTWHVCLKECFSFNRERRIAVTAIGILYTCKLYVFRTPTSVNLSGPIVAKDFPPPRVGIPCVPFSLCSAILSSCSHVL